MSRIRKKFEDSLLVRAKGVQGCYHQFEVNRKTVRGLEYQADVEFTIDGHHVYHGMIIDLEGSLLYADLDLLDDIATPMRQIIGVENMWKHDAILAVVNRFAQCSFRKIA